MTPEPDLGTAAALEALLDAELHDLQRADFSNLSRYIATKERLIATLHPGPGLPARTAESLRFKARRNEECLRAASRGIRAANRRILELQNIERGLETYDSHGQKAGLGHEPGLMEHKV